MNEIVTQYLSAIGQAGGRRKSSRKAAAARASLVKARQARKDKAESKKKVR